MNEKTEFRGNQIGACGVSCSLCRVSRHEKYRRFGFEWANRMLRKGRESKKGCIFWECSQEREAECCLLCEDFPCQTHYDSEEAVHTKQILDSWKELIRTGLTFWGRRKELESILESEDR